MTQATSASAVRSKIDLPSGNPDTRLGTLMPAEGENGVFAESWYPVCLSSELKSGEVRGETFLDGKIIIFRGDDGVARAMSAFCPHVGADLSVGSVAGNNIQCAFHKWEYDGSGTCVKTGIGDPAPKKARLFKFPTQECYGIVWVFNGEKPHWDIPEFEVPDENIVFRSYRFPDYFNCDPWVFAANTPDMQHLKVVHGTEFAIDDPHANVDWDDWGFRYKIIAAHQQGVPIEWTLGIRGTTLFWQEGPYGEFWIGGMVGFGIPAVGKHEVFATLALEITDDNGLLQERFDTAEALMNRTVGEDTDILNTIHYRPGTLTKGDTTLSRYLKFLRAYPRSHASGPFIK